MGAADCRSRIAFRNPVQREWLFRAAGRHDDACQIFRLFRLRQLGCRGMPLCAAGWIDTTCGGQCDRVRDEWSDLSDADRQPEWQNPVREHGRDGQQSRMRSIALLPARIAFRNPEVEAAVYRRFSMALQGRQSGRHQRQREIQRQRYAELREGAGDDSCRIPPNPRPKHHNFSGMRLQPARHD